jgi:effector-binding domain-containing protein
MNVEIRTLEPVKTMTIRSVIGKDQLGEAFMKSMPKVGGYLADKMAGPPFGLYHAYSEESVDVEIGMPVLEHVAASDDIQPSEIAGGRYAVATHVGSYDTLPQTYDALYKWVAANGHTDNGPPFESYIDDPGSTGPDKVRTEVCIPIA